MNVLPTTLHFRICFLGSLTFHRGPLLGNQMTLCWCLTPLLPIHHQWVYICYAAPAGQSAFMTHPLPGSLHSPSHCLVASRIHIYYCTWFPEWVA